MRIREFDAETDLDGLGRCVVALQDFERALVPSMPRGDEIRDAYVRDLLARCERHDGRIHVLDVGGQVGGFATLYARMISDEIDDGTEPYGWIGDLIVLELYRGHGHGRALLEAVERDAAARGVTTLRIGVLARNAAAVALYASRGFVPFAIQLEKTLGSE